MKFRIPSHAMVASAALLCAAATQAQVLDEIDVRREGADAVLQIRFTTEVQFQRAIVTRSGDMALVSYNLLTLINPRQNTPNQVLHLRAAQGLPDIEVADEPDRGEQGRRLVVRFGAATVATARAGRSNRSIELVLKGLGAAVAAAPAPAPRVPPRPATPVPVPAPRPAPATPPAPAASAERFVIVLQSSTDPAVGLSKPVPGSMQAYEVYTVQRTVDGVLRHEVHLGPFASRADAERALQQLSAFPAAQVLALAPTVAPPAVAVAPAPAAQSVPSAPGVAAAPAAPLKGTPELEAQAQTLIERARAAAQAGRNPEALEALNQLLELPPTSHTQEAQELAGMLQLRMGDVARARAEFETYLQLFPTGEGSERVRRELAALPAAPAPTVAVAAPPKPEPEVTINGSTSMTYYGGNGQVRSRDFQDSPIAGLPQTAGDPQLSSDRTRQLYNDVDINWRRRNAEVDQRFVFRDSYTTDLQRPDKNKNRLSALYFDHKSLTGRWDARLGRQSPTGGGVTGRFDGISGHWSPRPRLKFGAVVGEPTDKFFDSQRRFYGLSVDADRLLGELGAGAYVIEQRIDGQTDRRALGLEARYFKGGATVFSQLDYDTLIKGLNVASVQGTLIMEDNTVFNALYDRRALTTLALGNALTFEDPLRPGVLYTRIADKLATTTLSALRDQIKRITPMITQAQVGVTKPINKNWQTAASLQLTNTGAIPPVPEVAGFEAGRAATGNVITTSAQLIGLNLYSARDTHVLSGSVISSPTLKGLLIAYNNSSMLAEVWQMEPSLQYYRDRNDSGGHSQRWTPGLRITYRGFARWALESNLTYELGRATRVNPNVATPGANTTTEESAHRVNYSLGARYEF